MLPIFAVNLYYFPKQYLRVNAFADIDVPA